MKFLHVIILSLYQQVEYIFYLCFTLLQKQLTVYQKKQKTINEGIHITCAIH
jgi:hypothetical protein